MTDTRPNIIIFWQISSSPPRAANNIFFDLLLVFVVARITHVALACELTEKLTGTTVRGLFHQIRIDSHTAPIFTYSLYVYTEETIMPPRVLASGPKPCGGNDCRSVN